MSEFQYPPMTRISIKNMPDSYPQPKCDPKKVITLPPAAQEFTEGPPASIIFRHHDEHRNSHGHLEPHTSTGDNNSGEPTARKSVGEDVSPRKRSAPHARTVVSGHSPPVSTGTRPSRDAAQPVAPVTPRPQGVDGAATGVPRKAGVEGGQPSMQRRYGAPQMVRGSTIPRQPQVDNICSPAARNGRGKAHGMGRPLRPPTKH